MNTYPKFDVHYTFDNDDEAIVYVDTVKARTEQEAIDKIIKKYSDFESVHIQKVDLI